MKRKNIWLKLETCKICSNEFASNTDKEEHMKNEHKNKDANKKFYPCVNCSKVFNKSSQLRRHKRKICNQEVSCTSCSKLLTSKSELNYHMKTEHGEENFSDDEAIDQEVILENTKSELCVAGNFQEILSNPEEILNTFTCEFCISSFTSIQELKTHVERNNIGCTSNLNSLKTQTTKEEETEGGNKLDISHASLQGGD